MSAVDHIRRKHDEMVVSGEHKEVREPRISRLTIIWSM
jgi:hypothetical protein